MKNFIRNLMLIGFKFTDQELHEAAKKVDNTKIIPRSYPVFCVPLILIEV
jgi:hypothetical protein